ncbi:MAG TPA: helix-turn-helix domain-containing protein [Kribbella sp.]
MGAELSAGQDGLVTTSLEGQDLAAWARMLADGTRATVCLALLDGRAWTATELARLAGVSRPTISEHLNLLVDGGLLTEIRQGRHRYVKLAGPETAQLLEGLAAVAPRRTEVANSLSAASKRDAFARARTCYDHFAGKLGVALTDAMTERGLLDWTEGVALTAEGQRWLENLGIVVEPRRGRPAVRSCLDVTERRPHLAGAVGAALCEHALKQGWVSRIVGGRALKVTGSVQTLGLPTSVVRELLSRS